MSADNQTNGGIDFNDFLARLPDKRKPPSDTEVVAAFDRFMTGDTKRSTATPPPRIDTTDRARAYAAATLAAVAREVAETPEGSRNHTLNAQALRAYCVADAAGVDRRAVTDTMTAAGRAAGLDDREIAGTLRSAAAGADRHGPADIPEPGDTGGDTTFEAAHGDDGRPARWQLGGSNPPGWHAHPVYQFVTMRRNVKALWGDGSDILWADGEAAMIAGGIGLGKTTIAGQVIRAQVLNVGDGLVLDQPVRPVTGRVLYLAMDRPSQIARSLSRQFTDDELREIGDRLIVRDGPPVADMAKQPALLAQMADYYNAEVIYLDSLKDAAVGLSDDDVGAAYNRARQALIQAGHNVCELHHVVKRGNSGAGGRLTDMADVYGSTWLTAGCGSILGLSGQPGDPYIDFNHLRAPMTQLGPWTLYHDHDAGTITIHHDVDLLDMAAAAGAEGLTAKAVAAAIFQTTKPDRNQVERSRRTLDRKVAAGLLVRLGGGKGKGKEAAWFLASQEAAS